MTKMRCSCLTKKHKPCPIHADRMTEGKWYCHVHDPRGTFQKQVAAMKDERKHRRATGKPHRSALYAQELAALRRSMELDSPPD
jgi:hypothetical protein